MSRASSQERDGGLSRYRPARGRPLATTTAGFTAAARRRVKGVGRHAARHYDPTTGRRREENT